MRIFNFSGGDLELILSGLNHRKITNTRPKAVYQSIQIIYQDDQIPHFINTHFVFNISNEKLYSEHILSYLKYN